MQEGKGKVIPVSAKKAYRASRSVVLIIHNLSLVGGERST